MRIYLIGLMGSGKTTIGKKLAKKLDYQFIDLDELIENKTGISIADYFEKNGEENFRLLEQETLRETFNLQSAVISTGGGAPCFFSNMDEINAKGISIYLKTDVGLLVSRLKGATEQRPLIKKKNPQELKEYLSKLTSQREKYYLKANLVVSAKDLTAEKLVTKLNLPKI